MAYSLIYNQSQSITRSWTKYWSSLMLKQATLNFLCMFIYTELFTLLTHWGWVTHMCVVKSNINGSNNGLSPGQCQAIIGTNAVILLIGPLGTNFSEIVIEIQTFSFKKMHLKVLSAKLRPFCLGLNELMLKQATLNLMCMFIYTKLFSLLTSTAELTSNINSSKIVTSINTLRPRQNGRHFADVTFNRIFVNEKVRISIKFSLKFVPKCPINNIPALVQIMAWRRPGDKPLSEPVMVSLLTYICVTRPQSVNSTNRYN